MNNTQIQPLTIEEAQKIGGALHRLNEINSATIANPRDDAERNGLVQFLSNTMPKHANELLSCWFVMHNEYEPLIEGVANLLGRSAALNASRVNAIAQKAKADEAPPVEPPASNVIELQRPGK